MTRIIPSKIPLLLSK